MEGCGRKNQIGELGMDREDAHSAVSIGNTLGYEPECMVGADGCQKRVCAICWDCVLLVCFACGLGHYADRGYDARENRE